MAGTRTSLVLLPTYNERENLPLIVGQILNAIPTDVLIIDDNSPDGTGRIADQLAANHPQVHVLHRPKKSGLGQAYVAGYQKALEKNYDVLIQMDADFSHNPQDLPRLLEALENADFVLGSRYVAGGKIENWPIRRLIVSRFGSFYARSILGLGVSDLTGGFKAFKREVAQKIPWKDIFSDGYAFQIETTFRAMKMGFRGAEVPITFRDRTRGKSKISRRVILEGITIVWKLKLGKF